MKLSRHAFVRFWDVHAWLGVTGGLVLHVMFFAGGFALFYDELCAWQEPEVPPPAGPVAVAPLIERALAARDVRATSIDATLPGPGRRVVEIGWTDGRTGARGEARVVAATGAEIAETSHLARILFWLHFLYHPRAPWGMYAAGLFGAALMLAIATGVLIHLKDLVRQLHQLRPRRSARVLWSDLHKVLGVMGLPFQLTYAFTGALIALGPLLLLAFSGPVFGGDRAAAGRSWWGERAPVTLSGRRAAVPPIEELAARARAAVPGFQPELVRLEAIGDAWMTASFFGGVRGHLFARGDVVLDVADGTVVADLATRPATAGAAVNRWTTGLHYARFGGPAAKVLLAPLAAATCLTILTGNWIWLGRRERTGSRPGDDLLARLTTGVGGGVVLAAAALFLSNRLAPPQAREAAETWAFFGTWALTATAFLARAQARGGWAGLLGASGAGFAAVPWLSLAREGNRLGSGGAPSGVDIGVSVLGLALLAGALVLARWARDPAPAKGAPLPCPRNQAGEADR